MLIYIFVHNVIPFMVLIIIAVFSFGIALHILIGPKDIFFATPLSAIFMSLGLSLYVRSDHTHMQFGHFPWQPREESTYQDGLQWFEWDNNFELSTALACYEILMIVVQA